MAIPEDIIHFERLDDVLRGNTMYKQEFELLDEFEAPLDLSNTTIRCQFRYKSKIGPVTVDLSLGNGLTLVGSTIEIDEIKKIDWKVGKHFFDIEVYYILTDTTDTYIEGTQEIIQDTTHG